MLIHKILYALRTVVSSIKNNLLINLTALTTITLTFVIFVIFLILGINLSSFQKHWVERVHILVYLKDGIEKKSIERLSGDIAAQPEVLSVTFVSRDTAMVTLKASLEGQDGILEGLSYNPLPDSLEIKMKPEYLKIGPIEAFIQRIKVNKEITDIEYGQKWLDRFNRFYYFLRTAGLGIGVFLFISSLFIISNTIKLMVYNRRDEIEIMKLVGATRRFIKLPFYIEGALHGVFGSLSAVLIVYIITALVSKNIISDFHFYFGTGELLFLNSQQFCFVAVTGLVLGLAGAFISLNSLKEFRL